MAIYRDDCDIYPDTEIRALTKHSMELPGGRIVDYGLCAENFLRAHGGSGRCVGTRDVTEPSITFYSAPRPTRIVFTKRSRLLEFFDRENAVNRFRTICRLLEFGGYTTRDES